MKIYFVQPKNFNRTEKRTNPFFDPIIEVCEENGIEYLIYNPGRKSRTGYPRKKVRDSRHLRRFVSFFSKYFGRFIPGGAEYDIDRMAGRIWNLLTFGRDRADIYITVADELYGALPGLNPKARVVDVIHGVFNPGHWAYLDVDGRVSSFLRMAKEREIWVTGKGYKDIFMRKERDNNWVDRHIKVIGDVVGHKNFSVKNVDLRRKRMLITLQINNGCTFKENKYRYKKIVRFLREFSSGGMWNGFPILVKNHPRFNDCYDISEMMKEFPLLNFTDESFDKFDSDVFMHVTVDSTSAFDMAAYAIPTYFLYEDADNDALISEIWKDTHDYPYWGLSFSELVAKFESNSQESMRILLDWFKLYYKPIDKSVILDLIRH